MAKQEKNAFKELDKLIGEVPPELKKKVMGDVAAAKLILELASLFTSNCMSVIESLLKTRQKDLKS